MYFKFIDEIFHNIEIESLELQPEENTFSCTEASTQTELKVKKFIDKQIDNCPRMVSKSTQYRVSHFSKSDSHVVIEKTPKPTLKIKLPNVRFKEVGVNTQEILVENEPTKQNLVSKTHDIEMNSEKILVENEFSRRNHTFKAEEV